jgi:hypothetical protein
MVRTPVLSVTSCASRRTHTLREFTGDTPSDAAYFWNRPVTTPQWSRTHLNPQSLLRGLFLALLPLPCADGASYFAALLQQHTHDLSIAHRRRPLPEYDGMLGGASHPWAGADLYSDLDAFLVRRGVP